MKISVITRGDFEGRNYVCFRKHEYSFCEFSNYYEEIVRERTQDQKDRHTDWQADIYRKRKKESEKEKKIEKCLM